MSGLLNAALPSPKAVCEPIHRASQGDDGCGHRCALLPRRSDLLQHTIHQSRVVACLGLGSAQKVPLMIQKLTLQCAQSGLHRPRQSVVV